MPDLQGTLAQAVLETQAGRKEFRARGVTLFTNLFPTLPNRVEKARLAIRPMRAELDAKTARRCDEAAANLLARIQERQQQLQRAVFSRAEAPIFDGNGVARLTNWLATVEGGRATFSEMNNAGEPMLQVRVSSSDQSTLARWEKPVLLAPGACRFSATVTADQPVFRGPKPPVSLRIWGVNEVQLETNRPDPLTMEVQCTFAAPAKQPRVALAEQSGLPDASVALVTVAPALSWFQSNSGTKTLHAPLTLTMLSVAIP